jgi:hypothetical protein
VAGSALVTTVLIGGSGGDGIELTSSATLVLRHSTLAGGLGAGVDNSAGGTVAIAHSIVDGNAGGDLVGVPCASVSWSVIGTPDCSSVNDNLALDCLLDLDYRLGDGSPCLDAGPHPSMFTGDPCLDLDGGPRLEDFDGDGLARMDPGAYERADPLPAPPETADLRWVSGLALEWDEEPSAVIYHVYRGALGALSYADFGTCRDDLDPQPSDETLTDTELPAPGSGFFYLVTAEDASGAEGGLGAGTCAAASNFTPCP